MSLSKESQPPNRRYTKSSIENPALRGSQAPHSTAGNVIKLNTHQSKLKIVDYRSILEEIKVDKKNEVKVDLKNVMNRISYGEKDASRSLTHGNDDEGNSEKDASAKAFEEGFEAGKTEAAKFLQSEYEKKVQDNLRDLNSVTREFSKEVERYNQEFDSAVMKLAIAVAKRIVAREINIDEGAVLARSREAIRKIAGVDKIKIHVNPSDEEYIREHRNELMSYADSVKEIAIEGDNKVERGGCIIESDLGNIDARISTQFELVEEALLGLVK
ncbi:MAG: FliH/SctL family protein [Candidatus Kryptoniota bacterium]